MYEHRPTFVARKNPGFGWVVDVLWPDGETEVIKGFATERLSPIGSLNIPKVAKKIISKEKPAGVNRRAWRHKTFNLSSNPFSGRA
jgi:hypothetical protein